jgi:hypothetical protein
MTRLPCSGATSPCGAGRSQVESCSQTNSMRPDLTAGSMSSFGISRSVAPICETICPFLIHRIDRDGKRASARRRRRSRSAHRPRRCRNWRRRSREFDRVRRQRWSCGGDLSLGQHRCRFRQRQAWLGLLLCGRRNRDFRHRAHRRAGSHGRGRGSFLEGRQWYSRRRSRHLQLLRKIRRHADGLRRSFGRFRAPFFSRGRCSCAGRG